VAVTIRKRSPRAPSLPLGEALERALRVYDKEGKHGTAPDIIAQHLGYKDASNGAAISAIASLRYYGLLENRQDSKVAASKDLEDYKFAPREDIKRELAVKWLRSVPLFNDLLTKYSDELPSDSTIRYDLIQKGFIPTAAESVVQVFKKSVDWAEYFAQKNAADDDTQVDRRLDEDDEGASQSMSSISPTSKSKQRDIQGPRDIEGEGAFDRIPVRLAGGRKAWIEIPSPFFLEDKLRLKAQIDLILTDDEGGSHK